jgi:hypothetical protein
MNRADLYRQRARETRELARVVGFQPHRDRLLQMADRWLARAAQAEAEDVPLREPAEG